MTETGLDTRTIIKICTLHTCTSGYFGGCYPADGLPNATLIRNFPIFFIVNTQPSTVKYGHWVVILARDPMKVAFYDSFAKPPSHYHKDIALFIASLGGGAYLINNTKHQPSYSNLCAYYCLYVSDLWSRGLSFNRILASFNADNLGYNDGLVSLYFKEHIYSGLVKSYV